MEVAEPIARRLVAMWDGSVRLSAATGAGYLMRRQQNGGWAADRRQHKSELAAAIDEQCAAWLEEARNSTSKTAMAETVARKCRLGRFNKAILHTAKIKLLGHRGTVGTFDALSEPNG